MFVITETGCGYKPRHIAGLSLHIGHNILTGSAVISNLYLRSSGWLVNDVFANGI